MLGVIVIALQWFGCQLLGDRKSRYPVTLEEMARFEINRYLAQPGSGGVGVGHGAL